MLESDILRVKCHACGKEFEEKKLIHVPVKKLTDDEIQTTIHSMFEVFAKDMATQGSKVIGTLLLRAGLVEQHDAARLARLMRVSVQAVVNAVVAELGNIVKEG